MPLSSVNAVRGQAEIEEARQQMDTRPLLRCTAQPRTHVGESIHDISRNVSMVRYVASVVGRSSPESVSGVFRPCRDEVERCGAAWKRDADSSRSSPNYAPQATIQTSPPIRCFSRLVSVSIKAKYRFISRRTFLNHGTGLDTLAKSRISRSTSLITPFFRKRLPPSELSTETRRLSRCNWICDRCWQSLHPWRRLCLSNKGRLLARAEQRLRPSRKDDRVHDWCDRSNVSNRRLESQQPCARSTTHHTIPARHPFG
jgi:hypothetical protein